MNPYIVGRPVKNPADFYGRADEVEEIFLNIQKLQPVSLIGQRRMGRTSLLHYISSPAVAQKYVDPQKYILVYVDFEGLTQLSQDQFWRLILNEIKRFAKNSAKKVILKMLKKENIDNMDVYSIFQSFSDQNIRIVLCFDEFETVTLNKNFNAAFFMTLRYLVMSYENVTYITVSYNNLRELTHSKEIQSSPFFNMFNEMRVGFFAWEDTMDLIFKPSQKEGVKFNDNDSHFVLDVAYHHPFFIQTACYELFKYRTKNKIVNGEELDLTTYETLKETLYTKLHSHFEYYWNKLTNKEKEKLKELSNFHWKTHKKDTTIRNLAKYCLLKEKNGECGIFSSIFRKFCIETKIEYGKKDFYEEYY